jgi:hypothetical protein
MESEDKGHSVTMIKPKRDVETGFWQGVDKFGKG